MVILTLKDCNQWVGLLPQNYQILKSIVKKNQTKSTVVPKLLLPNRNLELSKRLGNICRDKPGMWENAKIQQPKENLEFWKIREGFLSAKPIHSWQSLKKRPYLKGKKHWIKALNSPSNACPIGTCCVMKKTQQHHSHKNLPWEKIPSRTSPRETWRFGKTGKVSWCQNPSTPTSYRTLSGYLMLRKQRWIVPETLVNWWERFQVPLWRPG